MTHRTVMSVEDAESLAACALAFLASEPARLVSFLDASGMRPEQLRHSMGDRQSLAAVLDHILTDDSLLLVFASAHHLEPGSIHVACHTLRNSTITGSVNGD